MAREHVQPAVGMAQLAAESAAFVGRFVLRRTRDAVPLQPSVQRAAAEVGDVVSLRRPSMSSGGNIVSCRKATTMASSAGVSTVLFGTFAPSVRQPLSSACAACALRGQVVAGGRAQLHSCDAWSQARRGAGAAVKTSFPKAPCS